MKTLNFNEVVFEIILHTEKTPLQGNLIDSGDAAFDTQCINATNDRLNKGDLWAWCTVEVKGTYRGIISASDYLGGCSYQNEKDFTEGGYFEYMKQSVIRLIQDQLDLVNA